MERRFAPRVALSIPIIAATGSDGSSCNHREFWGKIWNLSPRGGAGFNISRGALLPGDNITIYMELPGEEGILKKFNARVVWTKSNGVEKGPNHNTDSKTDKNGGSRGRGFLHNDIHTTTTAAAGVRFLEENAAQEELIKAIKYILNEEKERYIASKKRERNNT